MLMILLVSSYNDMVPKLRHLSFFLLVPEALAKQIQLFAQKQKISKKK